MNYTHTQGAYFARSLSVFWYKCVFLGAWFNVLSPRQQEAVLSHEEGHCHNHHTEIRILLLLLPVLWVFIPWICRWQEMQADRYAADRGHGQALHDFLLRGHYGGMLHPTNVQRRHALISPRTVPVTDQPPPARRNRSMES